MKIFSFKGSHIKCKHIGNWEFETRYEEMPDGKRKIYRKYGTDGNWVYEGWYRP